jgi:hypothetical protein
MGVTMTNSRTSIQQQTAGRRVLSIRTLVLSVVVLGLIGVVVFATLHEKRLPATPGVVAEAGLEPMRPPLTAAEEAYAAALWPLHSAVKLSAVNMTFAGLAYKLGELDRSGLHARLAPLAERFTEAALQFRQLQPPAALEGLHREYAEALRLYQTAITEMVRVIDDGHDEHLLNAQVYSEQAAAILIKLSDELWPGEYKPN